MVGLQMVAEFDQRAWLRRIGYDGSLEPTLGTLHQLILAHSHAIAYESLDIMLGRTPRLDLASLQRKMIIGGLSHGAMAARDTLSSESPLTRRAVRE